MGKRWSAIPDREVVANNKRWVCVAPDEAENLVDVRELYLLLQTIEQCAGDGAFSAITTDTFFEDGEEKTVWAVLADVYGERPFDENVAWGGDLVATLRELAATMANEADEETDFNFEDMDADAVVSASRIVRDSCEHGYIAWRHDTTAPENDIVELWNFDPSNDAPDVIGIGRGDDDVEALRNLLIGLRDNGVLA